MNEEHNTRVNMLMDELLERLHFEIEKGNPMMLPALAQAVSHLYQVKNGLVNADQKQMLEITLLKNINNQVKNFGQGGNQNGSGTQTERNIPS